MTKKKIYRAGFLPYHLNGDDKIEFLFMKPSDPEYGGSEFQMSKGKIDPGETPEQAAFREAKEELGLFKPNVIGDVKHLGNFLGRTEVYVGKIKDKNMFGDTTFETKETKWMTSEEFDKEGRDIHKPVIRSATRYINKKENLRNEDENKNER